MYCKENLSAFCLGGYLFLVKIRTNCTWIFVEDVTKIFLHRPLPKRFMNLKRNFGELVSFVVFSLLNSLLFALEQNLFFYDESPKQKVFCKAGFLRKFFNRFSIAITTSFYIQVFSI